MTSTIAAIYRYPVKGLSAEPLDRVTLAPGDCLPHDRRFAIALPSTRFDPENPEWLSKTHFVMLMRDAALANLKTGFDPATGVLTIADESGPPLRARITEPEGRKAAALSSTSSSAISVARPLRIVEAPGHAFADARKKPNATADKYVSLINRASLAALEDAVETPVDPLRFRANVYFDGPPAWRELDWIGSDIALGGRPITRRRGDHPLRRDRGQPRNRRARPRHARRPAPPFRPQPDGHLRRGDRGWRYRHRRSADRARLRDRVTLPKTVPLDVPARLALSRNRIVVLRRRAGRCRG